MSSTVDPPPPPLPVMSGRIPSRQMITIMGLGHIIWALLLFYVLLKTWPPDATSDRPMYFFSPISVLRFELTSGTMDQRLLFMVMALGALGALIHSSVSFTTYIGNRKFLMSWTWWYLLRPFVGAALALALYFVVRAGFLTSAGSTTALNHFGVAMLAIMSGLFSKQASDKLEEVFTTLFKLGPGQGDAQRGDKLTTTLTVTAISKTEGSTAGGTPVEITGTGFVDKATVKFGDAEVAAIFESATAIKAVSPPHAAGSVTVIVKNPDGKQAQSPTNFVYA